MSKGFGYQYSGTIGHIKGVAQSLPKSSNNLSKSKWTDISHPNQKSAGHYEYKENATGLKIRFDKGDKNMSGYRGKDHYHIYNPNATSNKDFYLDKNANPVSKSSTKSHILPKGDK